MAARGECHEREQGEPPGARREGRDTTGQQGEACKPWRLPASREQEVEDDDENEKRAAEGRVDGDRVVGAGEKPPQGRE